MSNVRYAAVMLQCGGDEFSVKLVQFVDGHIDTVPETLRHQLGAEYLNVTDCYSEVQGDDDYRIAIRLNNEVNTSVRRLLEDEG